MTRNEAFAVLAAAAFVPGRDEVSDERFATPPDADEPTADAARRKRISLSKACAALQACDPKAYAETYAAGKAERAGAPPEPPADLDEFDGADEPPAVELVPDDPTPPGPGEVADPAALEQAKSEGRVVELAPAEPEVPPQG